MLDSSIYQQATTVRGEFSTVMDKAIYEKPQLISRTKDHLMLIGADMLNTMLQSSMIHVEVERGDEDSFIYQLREVPDIFVEATSDSEAMETLAADFLEYAKTYYKDYSLYIHSPTRVQHLPYVMRALALGTPAKVRGMLCQAGKS